LFTPNEMKTSDVNEALPWEKEEEEEEVREGF
jgi:hypothetical protein